MTAISQVAPHLMEPAAIAAELLLIAQDEQQDRTKHDRRDFTREANAAANDSTQGVAIADEIRAEKTLFDARCRRRAERREALERQQQAHQDADATEQLEELRQQHADATQAAREALAGIEIEVLSAFEATLNTFFDAAENARQAAVNAAKLTQQQTGGNVTASMLEAPVSQRVLDLHERLQASCRLIASRDIQSRQDMTHFNVQRRMID